MQTKSIRTTPIETVLKDLLGYTDDDLHNDLVMNPASMWSTVPTQFNRQSGSGRTTSSFLLRSDAAPSSSATDIRDLLLGPLMCNIGSIRRLCRGGDQLDMLESRLVAEVLFPIMFDTLIFFLDQTFDKMQVFMELQAVCQASLFVDDDKHLSTILYLAGRLTELQHWKRFVFTAGRSTTHDPLARKITGKDAATARSCSSAVSLLATHLKLPKSASALPREAITVELANRLVRSSLQRVPICVLTSQDDDGVSVGRTREELRGFGDHAKKDKKRKRRDFTGDKTEGSDEDGDTQDKKPFKKNLLERALDANMERSLLEKKESSRKEKVTNKPVFSSGIEPLPIDIQSEILLFLAPRALVCAEATCRMWHSIVSHTPGMLLMVEYSRTARNIYMEFMEHDWGVRHVKAESLLPLASAEVGFVPAIEKLRSLSEAGGCGKYVDLEENDEWQPFGRDGKPIPKGTKQVPWTDLDAVRSLRQFLKVSQLRTFPRTGASLHFTNNVAPTGRWAKFIGQELSIGGGDEPEEELPDQQLPESYDSMGALIERNIGGLFCPGIFHASWLNELVMYGVLTPEHFDLLT